MKKLLFLFLCFLTISCSSDSKPNKSISEKILGKWHFESSADGGLIKTTPASGCALFDYNTYTSDKKLKTERGYLSAKNECFTNIANLSHKIIEYESTIYLTHSYYNLPTDKLETEIKFKIVELSENKLTIQALSIGHYKIFNGVSVYIVDEYEPINKTISYYSKI